MVYSSATVAQVCEYFNGTKGNLPIILNVQNMADYRVVHNEIVQNNNLLRTSDYFGNSLLPDMDKMLHDVKAAGERTIVLGLFHAFAFTSNAIAIKAAFGEIANCTKKILILTYGLQDIIEKKLKEYLPLRDKAQIYLINGKVDNLPKLSLTTFDFKKENFYPQLKDFFWFLEEYGGGHGVVKSDLTEKAFEAGIWSVEKPTTAFESLKELDGNLAGLDENYGTNKQWEELIKDIKGSTFKDLLSPLGIDLLSAVKKFKIYNETQKWRIFLWLKIEQCKGYLSLVAQNAQKAEDVVSAVYNAILTLAPKQKAFLDFYAQRKELIIAINDDKAIREFVKLCASKEKEKVQYLTDATDVERKEILSCFAKYDYSAQELREIAQRIYPLLADYLTPFDFNNEILNSYFEEYKTQKVKNYLSEEFKKKVELYARPERPFNSFQTRAKVISGIKADESIIYWVDALGVEFCGLINQRCKHYGISAKIKTARSELPTLTKFNQDFAPLKDIIPIKHLDDLKHKGENDYDYTKTQLPLYIEAELRIIDGIIKQATADLANKKKVIIISDHGASRLVRIADNILTISVDTKEGEKDEKHGGRCCAWNPIISQNFETVTDSDNNGFCVIANYDRFKGGKYTGVELHGGATLEEVIVPIIEITNKTTDYRHSLRSSVLTLRNRKTEPLIISLSSEVQTPRIKIHGQSALLSPIKIDETTYTFETGIMKSGKYNCSFFDDNEEIILEIRFEVRSALGGINDDLI